MKLFLYLCFSLIIISFSAEAQFSKYVIRLKDKATSPYSISNPSQYLSARAIARRTRQNIAIDETDIPITPRYIDSIRLAGAVTILNTSKWLNQVCIQTTDAVALAKIQAFPFVLASQPVRRTLPNEQASPSKFNETITPATPAISSRLAADYYNYGNSGSQIKIHEGEYLHNLGFHGEGMLMAIMDGGFFSYQTITAFDSVRLNGQIKETYDFVKNEISVNEDDPHGMQCFSIIAGNWPGQLVGSSPKANFYLYRTEDVGSEYPIEEQNWIAAAERADSIGVDVFSTSLGYTTFDNPAFNHSYPDMNGNTTMITKASDLASKKGIIVVTAAGNDGTNGWRYISAPADADSCVTVGAVTASGTPAGFSSYGPSSDGQIKPTVASVGVGTALAGFNNQPSAGNGTSFATPNLAGLITCLWQAFPDFTNMEIIDAVKRSSSLFTNPNDRVGYGIPNFRKAYIDLETQRIARDPLGSVLKDDWIKVYPNPFGSTLRVVFKTNTSGKATIGLYDATGKLYMSKEITTQANMVQVINFDNLQPMARSMYTLKFDDGDLKRSIQLIKK